MSCYYPIPVKNIGYTDQGKQILTTSWRGSQLDYDFMRPCGRCIGCITDLRQDWAVRLYHESKLHDQAAMITLTYADEFLPERGELKYHDVQVFLKRIRRDAQQELRYYVAGEHGEKYGRPHWHMILYGADYLEGSQKYGSEENPRFRNSRIDEMWAKGNTDIIPVSAQSCAYAAGYVNKKAGEEGVYRQSRKPPIAKPWVEQNLDYLISRSRADGRLGVGHRRYTIPKIYLEWFPDELSEIIDRNKEHTAPFESLSEIKNRNRETNRYARVNIRDQLKKL